VLAVTEALVTDWHAEGLSRERTGPTLPGIAPSNVYPTSDGQVLIAANQDSVFARLVAVMGQAELAADPRFASHQARAGHVAEIDAIVSGWTLTRSSAEVLTRLHEAGVPAGLVYEPRDMLEDPHFAARESLVRVPDEKYGEIVMQGVFPRLSQTPGRVRRAGPPLGADTDDVLRELLGLEPEQICRLRNDQII
jgi:crotonobetainyl-CoA:carnitine CoA-transferase CaiB-like acyl-CoA transferase